MHLRGEELYTRISSVCVCVSAERQRLSCECCAEKSASHSARTGDHNGGVDVLVAGPRLVHELVAKQVLACAELGATTRQKRAQYDTAADSLRYGHCQ